MRLKVIGRKRRRENKTDYAKRKKLLCSGKPRIVIRKTNRYMIVQYVESNVAEDKVKVTVTSRALLNHGWPKEKAGSLKNLAACYLAGLLFGKKVLDKKKKDEAILDMGLIKSTKGSRVYACLKGAVEAGLKIKHDEKMFPEEKRIINEKVAEFFNKVKENISGGSGK